MTVYVDDMRVPARVGRIEGRWSHLIADTEEELHEFAQRLGLLRRWFQDPRTQRRGALGPAKPGTYAGEAWHYDVVDTKRERALELGAIAVSWRDFPNLIHHRIEHGVCRLEA